MISFHTFFESYEKSKLLTPAEEETHTELIEKFQKILAAADIHLTLAQLAVPLMAFGGSHINDLSGINKVFYTNGRQIIESLIKHGANRSEIDALLAIEKKRAENLAERERIESEQDKIRKASEDADIKRKEYEEMKEIRDKHYPIKEYEDGGGGVYYRVIGLVDYFRTLKEAEDYRDEERPVKVY